MFAIMIIVTIKSNAVFKRIKQEQPITDVTNKEYLDTT